MILYIITNNITNKQYVGITTTSLNKRWSRHKYESQHSNKPLYNSINKYGINNFNIEIAKTFQESDDLIKAEIKLIKKLNTIHPYGYNMTSGGELKKKYCIATKRKIGRKVKEWHKYNKNPRSKEVIDIKTKETYKSAKECWLVNNIKCSRSYFVQKLNGKVGNETDFRFVGSENICKKYNGPSSKEVINIKTKEIYKSVKECAEKNNVNIQSLYSFLNGKVVNYTDFQYLNKDISKKPKQEKFESTSKKILNVKTGEIYKSIKECAIKNNVNYSTLKNKINGNKRNNSNFKYL